MESNSKKFRVCVLYRLAMDRWKVLMIHFKAVMVANWRTAIESKLV